MSSSDSNEEGVRVEQESVQYRPAVPREEAILSPTFIPKTVSPNEGTNQIVGFINKPPPTDINVAAPKRDIIVKALTLEEAIQKQLDEYFSKLDFSQTKSTFIGQLGKNLPSIQNLTVSRESQKETVSGESQNLMVSRESQKETVSMSAIASPDETRLATKLAKMYPDKVDIGPEAVARRKKPNVDDLDDDNLQEMFAEWLRANDIDPDVMKRRAAAKQTFICDTDRDMDVIRVDSIPTRNGLKSLELLVPQKKLTGLHNLTSKKINETNDPASNEQFAENYVKMLGLKVEMEEEGRSIEMHNRLSSILFRCMLSLVLGYLYNNGLDMLNNAMTTGALNPDEAKDIAFQFTQEQVDAGIIQEGNYTAIGETYDMFYSLLIKENALSSDFKKFILPDGDDAPLEQNFETLLEMIVRLANMPSGTEATPYFTILQSVCFSITLILNKYELITTAAGELVGPYWESVVYLAAEDSTIMQRLQSIVILAVAYNSYGWLFTVMAPLALPSLVSVGSWALCSLARLPFGIIKFTGKALLSVGKFFVGYQEDPNIMPIDAGSENTLIQVGWIKKKVGNDIKLIPHMVSKGDVQRLSQYIANHEIQKPSLLSSIFDAHGVADHDLQGPHSADEWAWYLRNTNPVGRLMGCIAEEFAELTVVEDTEEVGYVKTLEERLFTLVCRTLRNERGDNGFTLIPLVEMWTETLFTKFYETTDATLTAFNAGFENKFKDTLLEAIVIMLSGSYVDYTISRGEFTVSQPPLSPASSTDSNMSSLSSGSRSFLSDGSEAYSYRTANGDDVVISVRSEDSDTIHLDIEVPSRESVPSLSRTPSNISEVTVDSGDSKTSSGSLSEFLDNEKGLTISIGKQISVRKIPSILLRDKDPSVLFNDSRTNIFQDLRAMAKQKQDAKKAATEEAQKAATEPVQEDIETIVRLNRLLDSLSTEEPRTPNLSGFLLADAVGTIMNGFYRFSLWVSPLEKGGYRRRNVPILATIGRKIVNNGIYRAIKPKLIASVYGKSKRRQRKRYTKKRGLKRGRKQTTKKIHRKRRSTHKKYKRR